MMKKKNTIITILVLIIIALVIGWLYGGNKQKIPATSPAAIDTAHVNPIPPDSLHH